MTTKKKMNEKILIIDQEGDLLPEIGPYLAGEGFNVVITESCSNCLDMLRDFGPDLVILDIRADGPDGKEFCRKLKEMASCSHIPVILVSTEVDASRDYSLYGANAFLRRPFGQLLFLSLVYSLLPAGDSLFGQQQIA